MPHTPKRVVPVEVDVITSTDGTVTITCTPNTAEVTPGTKHALIVFRLNTTGYRFPTLKAITLDNKLDDFPYHSWTMSDTEAALYDTNRNADIFGYTVTVINNCTGKESSVDPEIKNGGDVGTGGH
jgi:hypothetical protein